MTPQELKESIFQKAIQGTLVEQRVTEGSVRAVYESIKELHLSGKKKKADFSIMDEEIPYDIPESWIWLKLGEVCKIVNGFTPKKTNLEFWENGTIPWFTIDDVRRQGRFISETSQFISEKALSKNSDRIVPANTVLLCCTASVGEYAYTRIPLTTNQQFNALVINDGYERLIDSLYIYQYVQTLKHQLISNAGKTTFNFLSVGKLAEFLIPIPPLAEQHRIVAKIEELLPLIDRYEKAYTRLEDFNKRFPADMQKSILQMAIQGKLVEQRAEEGTGEELYQQIQKEKQALIKEKKIKKEKPLPEITEDDIPFDIPESWKWVRLVELGVFSSGKTPTMGEAKYWCNGSVQWFTSKDMKKKYLDVSEMKITELAASGMRRYPAGTLLMVVRSGILKRMLPLCILTQESTINQDIKAYQLFDTALSEYIYFMLKGMETYILKNYRKQVTTVDSLKFDEFSREMLIPLPPLAEQKRIVAKLEELLPLCDKLKK